VVILPVRLVFADDSRIGEAMTGLGF
jgi:hypothetical protein